MEEKWQPAGSRSVQTLFSLTLVKMNWYEINVLIFKSACFLWAHFWNITRHYLHCLLCIIKYRYNYSPAAEQHIQQSVLDLPDWHQCIRCRLPLGVHRYEEGRLACLPVTLSAVDLFLCVRQLPAAAQGYRKRESARWKERECGSEWVGRDFSSSGFSVIVSAFLASYSRMMLFFKHSHCFKLLDPQPFSLSC